MMSRIRRRDTAPELKVRRWLHAQGLRFRLDRGDLPGRPDIVLPKWNLAIFVHGCFWHQHPRCRLASRPKTNMAYWVPKLAGNKTRDRRNIRALKARGWDVAVIWECRTRNPGDLAEDAGALLKRTGIRPATTKHR
jgi:DNA mismatch endonuclease (patch repair protein)